MNCPNCGAENQKGKFCAECGAGLKATCPECGAAVPAGASFCTKCGEPIAGGGGGGGLGSKAGWIIAAAAVLVVALVLLLPGDTRRVAPAGMGGGAAPEAAPFADGAGSPDGVLSTDMRTNADRLFNRIMTAAEAGNQAEVEQFMPMAIQAYDMAGDLDADGLFHLAILYQTAGQYGEAMATAQKILDDSPNNVLGLGVAAGTAAEQGDSAQARTLYRRLLDHYQEEAGKPLPEYVDHQPMLQTYREMARKFLGES